MCCCNSSTQAFAWIGALLVNIGFISLISWGAATLWPLGFVLSVLYTCFLFGLANWFEQKGRREGEEREGGEGRGDDDYAPISTEYGDATTSFPRTTMNTREADPLMQPQRGQQRPVELTEDSSNTENNEESTTVSSIQKRIPILVSLLYGLAVLSMGVSGFFLPVNLVPKCNKNGRPWEPKWVWITNITDLPPSVQDWAASTNNLDEGATFGYVPSTGITLFQGSDYKSSRNLPLCVWTTQSIGPPIEHRNFQYPNPFLQVTETAVCFQTMTVPPTPGNRNTETIVCSDGNLFQPMIEPNITPIRKDSFRNFKSSNGMLWFKVQVTPRNTYNNDDATSGVIIYSLDPTNSSMVATIHSHRVKAGGSGDEDHDSCQESKRLRIAAAVALCTTALPITILSIILWKMKQIPSMGVTTYVGCTTIYFSILVIVTSDLDNIAEPVWGWWFALSGLLWLIISSYLILLLQSQRQATRSYYYQEEPLQWGLMITGIAYFFGMSWVIMHTIDDGPGQETFWRWAVLNVSVFGPLILFGMITSVVFLTFLGAIGFLVDAARFAAFVGEHAGGQGSTPLIFLVFAFSGLGVGAIGYQLTYYQDMVKIWARDCVTSINSNINNSNNDDDDDERRQEMVEQQESMDENNDDVHHVDTTPLVSGPTIPV